MATRLNRAAARLVIRNAIISVSLPVSYRQFSIQPYTTSAFHARPIKDQQTCLQKRWESSARLKESWELRSFKEVLEYSRQSGDLLIIDVREPHEYLEGHIPGAVNLPVNSSPDAVFLDPHTFEQKFGFEKPDLDKPVLFYCKAGVRSRASAGFAKESGYKNVNEYRGSFDDWLENSGPTKPGDKP